MERKVQLKVYVDEGIRDALRSLVKRKYPSTYGALSEEVQCALIHWIHENEATITQKLTNPTTPKSHQAAQQIMFHLKEKGFTTQCSYKDLRKSIESVRGMDIRTVRKWLKFLGRNGYIKQLRTYIYEIL